MIGKIGLFRLEKAINQGEGKFEFKLSKKILIRLSYTRQTKTVIHMVLQKQLTGYRTHDHESTWLGYAAL